MILELNFSVMRSFRAFCVKEHLVIYSYLKATSVLDGIQTHVFSISSIQVPATHHNKKILVSNYFT